jgi:hypothetical protein
MKSPKFVAALSAALLLLISAGSAAANPELKEVTTAEGQYAPLSVEIFVDEYDAELTAADSSLNPPGLAASRFVKAAIANDTDRILGALSSEDDSREMIEASLADNPDKYSRWSKMEEVRHNWTAYWGKYRFVQLEAALKGGQKIPLRPAVLCLETCGVSTIDRRDRADIRAVNGLAHTYGVLRGTSEASYDKSSGDQSEAIDFEYAMSSEADYPIRGSLEVSVATPIMPLKEAATSAPKEVQTAVKIIVDRLGEANEASRPSTEGEKQPTYWQYRSRSENQLQLVYIGPSRWWRWLGSSEEIRLLGWVSGEGYRLLIVDLVGESVSPNGLQIIGVNLEDSGPEVTQEAPPLGISVVIRTNEFYQELKNWHKSLK